MSSETMTDEEQQLIDCLQRFISDLTNLFQMIEMTSTANLLVLPLDQEGGGGEGETSFALPATFRSYEQRAISLQHRFQRFVRSKAQRRREEISKGIEAEFSSSIRQIRWENDVKTRLSNLPKTPLVAFLRTMVNALDLYVEILGETSSANKTFRILPILQYLQRQVFVSLSFSSSLIPFDQLCNISITIQRLLETNGKTIDAHLRQVETKLKMYDREMKEKLTEFLARDVRPPVLVIPCPTPLPPSELLDRLIPSVNNEEPR